MNPIKAVSVPSSRRAAALIAVLAALGLALGASADPAQAGRFRVTACGPANAVFAPLQSSNLYTVAQSCPKTEGRFGAGTGLDAATTSLITGLAPIGSSAAWSAVAPPGAVFGELSYTRYVTRGSESWTVGVGADNGAGGAGLFLDGYLANDGSGNHDSSGWQPRSVNAAGRTRIIAGVLCGNPTGCGTTPGNVRARYAIADIALDVYDSTPPSVALDGPPVTGAWAGRKTRFDVSATDNVGIQALYPGGGERQTRLPISDATGERDPFLLGCQYDRLKPCPDLQAPYTVDLSPLPDGRQPVQLLAFDAADNTASAHATVNVDNTPPTAPRAVTVAGGDGWKRTNDFTVTWENPAETFAPIVAARYVLCRAADGGGCIEGRQAGANLSSLQAIKVPGVGEWRLRIALEDAAGNYALATGADAILRFDDIAPSAPVIAPLDSSDPTMVSAVASDQGSGVASGAIAYRQVGSSAPWTSVPTALDGGKLVARIDDRKLRAATYELAATAVDGAGNATTSNRRGDGSKAELTAPLRVPMGLWLSTRPIRAAKTVCRVKRVRNAKGRLVKKRVCRQAAVKAPRPLRTLRVAYAKRRQIFGLVTSREGKPLAGVEVVLRARARRLGAQTRRVATVTTNAAGRFSYLARGTQSRRLLAIYPGTATLGYAGAQVDVAVPAKVKLRAVPARVKNGKSTTFSGRLVGAPFPPGKLIALQVVVRGEWRPFKTVRAAADGRFSAAYRFAVTSSTTRYRFRALVPREPTYAYDAGASRPISVVVRP